MSQPLDLSVGRRILKLETLYDLLVALHGHHSEDELVEDLLHRVCAVLDPGAAAVVTRDGEAARAAATVGWPARPPGGQDLLEDPLWRELLSQGVDLERRDGSFSGRPFRHLLAVPIQYRSVFMGYLAILDKETRRGHEGDASFAEEDRRFLAAVAALTGVIVDGLRQVADLVTESERLAEENKALRGRLVSEADGRRIVAYDPAMRQLLERVERIAPRTVSVLVRGESGTGKELIAKLLHLLSERSGALVAVNCAALPDSLLESELFGIEGGVATGVRARAGKFELANGGTLFLDEIGDMDQMLQAKLLRALQEREVVRVGGAAPIPVDVRVVAATHRDVEDLVAAGEFREDLYYRLRVVEVELPPLRERRQDIPHLVRHFADEFCEREGIPVPRMRREALGLLLGHDYPGNVRELQNLVEGAVSLADPDVDGDLVHSLLGTAVSAGPEPLDLDSVVGRHIQRVLRLSGGNKSAAARLLGVDRRTLQRKGF
ncbi:MAG: sigma 54-interacting transcriptional regulator [Acidobacteriota bacterium]|nr:sigma 54-interacting transcriptional regulator [Acidobacteriota bacterium]